MRILLDAREKSAATIALEKKIQKEQRKNKKKGTAWWLLNQIGLATTKKKKEEAGKQGLGGIEGVNGVIDGEVDDDDDDDGEEEIDEDKRKKNKGGAEGDDGDDDGDVTLTAVEHYRVIGSIIETGIGKVAASLKQMQGTRLKHINVGYNMHIYIYVVEY